jgi:hypothetical protein
MLQKPYCLCNKIARIGHWSRDQNAIDIGVFSKLMIKSRRMRTGGQVARMENRRNAYRVIW